MKMAVFNGFRPGYELIKVEFEWNVQVPFLQSTDADNLKQINSSLFSPRETPDSQWILSLYDEKTYMSIRTWHYNSAGKNVYIADPVLVKISILNKKKKKIIQQILSSKPNSLALVFDFPKEDVIKSDCQQENGSYTFLCKILCHVKNEPVTSAANLPDLPMDSCGALSTQFEKLFEEMQFSDVNFLIGGREFPAHKSILAARSKVFAAMFQHPVKENSTNQIAIEDMEPEVFQEMLRFIYTGRVLLDKMESLAAGLFIAADKYLLDELKGTCENYLLHHMSPDNCIVLLLHGDLINPSERLKEAAKFFRRYTIEVMATDGWEKAKQENPVALVKIHEFLYR